MLPHLAAYHRHHNLPPADLALFSPGRINVIGEHTDYTGGLVLPAAIDLGLEFYAWRLPDGDGLELHAVDLDETYRLELPVTGRTGRQWVDYLAGIVHQFTGLGHRVPGLRIVFGGNVPSGAGLSSSAALEGGMAFLLNEVTGAGLSRPALAALCQRSSNGFLGIPSGIMDQFASLNGSSAGPILLDCHDHAFRPVRAELGDYDWLLVNSLVTHDHGTSAYRDRVAECAAALEALRGRFPNLTHLSAATAAQLDAVADVLDPAVKRRAYYVVRENERVRRMVEVLPAGDAAAVGELLNAGHAGLRDAYEVTCLETDFLQSRAVADERVAGARQMGGGFGGCVLTFVRRDAVEGLKADLTAAYRNEFGREPAFYDVRLEGGTRLLSV